MITRVIIAANAASGGIVLQATLFIPIALFAVSVWLSFRLAPAIALKLSASDTHVVTRLIGPIIAAVSIDMISADSASCFQNC